MSRKGEGWEVSVSEHVNGGISRAGRFRQCSAIGGGGGGALRCYATLLWCCYQGITGDARPI